MSRLRAIIFDCDGVIADTEPVHCDAFARTLAEHKISMSREEYYADCLGFDDEGLIEHIFRRDGNPLSRAEMDTLLARKRELYMDLIEADRVQLPGVVDFVRAAGQRWPLAICSAAIRPEVDHITEALGIASCFAVIVTAENVAWARGMLGLGELITAQHLTRRYRRLAIRHHPDRCNADDRQQATRKFDHIERAYRLLTTLLDNYSYSFRPDDLRRDQEHILTGRQN